MKKRALKANFYLATICGLAIAGTACSNDSKKASSDEIEGNVEIEVVDESNTGWSESDYSDNNSNDYNTSTASDPNDDGGDNFEEFLIN